VSLEGAAVEALCSAFGDGVAPVITRAPGRVTLVGEHVDYVGGRVACMAIDRGVAVAARPSRDRRWRVVSAGRSSERGDPAPRGDIGDRLLAPAVVLGDVPPLEVGVAADIPESAGLSSSAAVAGAALVVMLRLTQRSLTATEAVDTLHVAEHDVLGVPCGRLDQRAIVESTDGAVLIIDCSDGSATSVAWPGRDVALVVAWSGEKHDVGGAGYRARRAAGERVLSVLGVTSSSCIGRRWQELGDELRPAGRHIATETQRVSAAVAALRLGDAAALGALIDASHASLRDDLAVSTPRLEAMTAAAREVPGCLGSRLVGAGFGGSAIALCLKDTVEAVRSALTAAAGRPAAAAWGVRPAAGLSMTAADVVVTAVD